MEENVLQKTDDDGDINERAIDDRMNDEQQMKKVGKESAAESINALKEKVKEKNNISKLKSDITANFENMFRRRGFKRSSSEPPISEADEIVEQEMSFKMQMKYIKKLKSSLPYSASNISPKEQNKLLPRKKSDNDTQSTIATVTPEPSLERTEKCAAVLETEMAFEGAKSLTDVSTISGRTYEKSDPERDKSFEKPKKEKFLSKCCWEANARGGFVQENSLRNPKEETIRRCEGQVCLQRDEEMRGDEGMEPRDWGEGGKRTKQGLGLTECAPLDSWTVKGSLDLEAGKQDTNSKAQKCGKNSNDHNWCKETYIQMCKVESDIQKCKVESNIETISVESNNEICNNEKCDKQISNSNVQSNVQKCSLDSNVQNI